jgi:hypothetical protein
MIRDDLITLAICITALLLVGGSVMKIEASWKLETKLTAELTALNEEAQHPPQCLSGNNCEYAIWKLTVESKQSQTYRDLVVAQTDNRNSKFTAALTLVGFLLIFWLYPELWQGLRNRFRRFLSRFRREEDRNKQTEPGV